MQIHQVLFYLKFNSVKPTLHKLLNLTHLLFEIAYQQL